MRVVKLLTTDADLQLDISILRTQLRPKSPLDKRMSNSEKSSVSIAFFQKVVPPSMGEPGF